jgi:flavin reductase (DIM6/NTAB) family NADH-FMN oxidoreductase RutF
MSIAEPSPLLAEADILRDGFRLAMRRLASGVAVVTCQLDDEWAGMSATSVTSLSMSPPSLVVCINRNARVRQALAPGRPFTVNLLDQAQGSISAAFGGEKSGPERFNVGRWRAGETGVPFLEDGLAIIDCRVDGTVEYGTHSIIIGRVDHVRLAGQAMPLIYFDGQYQ